MKVHFLIFSCSYNPFSLTTPLFLPDLFAVPSAIPHLLAKNTQKQLFGLCVKLIPPNKQTNKQTPRYYSKEQGHILSTTVYKEYLINHFSGSN